MVGIMLMFALILTVSLPVTGENIPATDYNHANALYRDGDFAGALRLYETLIAAGVINPDLYYNASNAAYRTGMLGRAILYQERALKLAPYDDDSRTNLAFLENLRQDVESVDDNPLVAMISGWYGRCRPDSFARSSSLGFAFALVLATIALFTTEWKRLTLWITVGTLLTIFAVSTGLFVAKLHHELTVIEAIVLAPEVTVHSGPGTENAAVFSLHEGTKVVIERSQDGWSLIRLGSGAAGWIPLETAERI